MRINGKLEVIHLVEIDDGMGGIIQEPNSIKTIMAYIQPVTYFDEQKVSLSNVYNVIVSGRLPTNTTKVIIKSEVVNNNVEGIEFNILGNPVYNNAHTVFKVSEQ